MNGKAVTTRTEWNRQGRESFYYSVTTMRTCGREEVIRALYSRDATWFSRALTARQRASRYTKTVSDSYFTSSMPTIREALWNFL